jgi:hypothetical protein
LKELNLKKKKMSEEKSERISLEHRQPVFLKKSQVKKWKEGIQQQI